METTSNKIEDVNEVFDALAAWINRKPGLEPREYGHGPEGYRAYRQEGARHLNACPTKGLTSCK